MGRHSCAIFGGLNAQAFDRLSGDVGNQVEVFV
jgi:hypothetical protein